MSRRTARQITERGRRRRPGALHSRPVLLLAFAFAVMADPVSSVAYAIEAALRAAYAGNPDLPFWIMTVRYGQFVKRALLSWCDESLASASEA